VSSVIGIILRLGALLSLPVRRAGRVLLHPRGLLSRADLLAPESRKVSSSRRSNGGFFTSLPERCACGRSLAVERLSAITVEAEADGPAKSWQLAVGSWQLDVAIANGPSFRSAMAEDVTIDGDVVCATSSSLLTAPSWSSRDWWMVDGLLRRLWRWSSERTRWSEGFWVLGSGFWVLPGLCFDAKRVVSTTARCEGKIYGVRAANGSPAHNRSRLRLDGFGIFALRQYPRTWT
jgi:hypothetical protein